MSHNFNVTIEEIKNARANQLGGVCFPMQFQEGPATLTRLNSGVDMTREEFGPQYQGKNGFHALGGYYKMLNYLSDYFFVYEEKCNANGIAVYSFVYDDTKNWRSLNEYKNPMESGMALAIFKKLLNAIKAYSTSGMIHQDGCYIPLNFICRDSVYIRFDSEGELDMRLLPIPCSHDCDYAGMPRVSEGVYTDIYMAAYLYITLKYPDGKEFVEFDEIDMLAMRFLSPISWCRNMSLDELIGKLNEIADPKPNGASDRSSPVKEVPVSGNTLSDDDDDDSDDYYEDEYKPGEGTEDGFMAKEVEKGKKFFRKTIDRIHDKFEQKFSTEEGDAEEEEADN